MYLHNFKNVKFQKISSLLSKSSISSKYQLLLYSIAKIPLKNFLRNNWQEKMNVKKPIQNFSERQTEYCRFSSNSSGKTSEFFTHQVYITKDTAWSRCFVACTCTTTITCPYTFCSLPHIHTHKEVELCVYNMCVYRNKCLGTYLQYA